VVIQDLRRADVLQCFEGSGRGGRENGVAGLYLIRFGSNSALEQMEGGEGRYQGSDLHGEETE